MAYGKKKKVNYLNNADLLVEIHKTKISYSYYTEPKYTQYDIIIDDISVLTTKHELDIAIKTAIENKVRGLNKGLTDKTHSTNDYTVEDIVFRLMTYDHIPLLKQNETNSKNTYKQIKKSAKYETVNFNPYQHWIIVDNTPHLVGLSHHNDNKEFCITHGQYTSKLSNMFILLTEQISHKPNWANYTYKEDMKSLALLQLVKGALKFDESRITVQLNPFAYYTTIVSNAFKCILNKEKKMRDLKDDLREEAGQPTSLTRQLNQIDYNDWNKTTKELKYKPSNLAKAKAARSKKADIKKNTGIID